MTSSAASLQARLIHETIQQAMEDGAEMALSPSAGWSESSSMAKEACRGGETGGAHASVVRRPGEKEVDPGEKSRRKMKLAAHAAEMLRMPLHLLCSNHAITGKALTLVLEAAPWAAAVPDRHGLLPLHVLCTNRKVTPALLATLLAAFPQAASLPCNTGLLPLHYLSQSPAAEAEMLRLLLEANPHAVTKLGRGGGTILHQLAASKVHAGARRLPGGMLEGTEAELNRRRRRQHNLELLVRYDNRTREQSYDQPSGPHVGDAWAPVPTKIKGATSDAVGNGSAERFRRVVPCVALSAKERAMNLKRSVQILIENRGAHEGALHADHLARSSQDPESTMQEEESRRRQSEHVDAVLSHPVAAVISLLMMTAGGSTHSWNTIVERHIYHMRSSAQDDACMERGAGLRGQGWVYDSIGRVLVEDGLVRMARKPCECDKEEEEERRDPCHDDEGVSVVRREPAARGRSGGTEGSGGSRMGGSGGKGERGGDIDISLETDVLRQVIGQVRDSCLIAT